MTLAIIWPPTSPAAAQALLESAGELPGRHRACASGCVRRAQISTRELRTAAGLGPELPDLALPKEALGAALNTAPGVPPSVLALVAAWSASPGAANLSMPTKCPQHHGQVSTAWGRAACGARTGLAGLLPVCPVSPARHRLGGSWLGSQVGRAY